MVMIMNSMHAPMAGASGGKIMVMQKTGPDAIFGGAFPRAAVRSGSFLPHIKPIGDARAYVSKAGSDIRKMKPFGFGPEEEQNMIIAFNSRPAAIASGRKIGYSESVVFIMRETPPGEPGAFRAWGPMPGRGMTSGSYVGSDKNVSLETGGIAEFMQKIPSGTKVIIYAAMAAEEERFASFGKAVYRATSPCGEGIRINPVISGF